jgi:hypothetical protein
VLNEVPFLKDIDKTPTFLVYHRKRGTFTQVDTASRPPTDDPEVLAKEMIALIDQTIKAK